MTTTIITSETGVATIRGRRRKARILVATGAVLAPLAVWVVSEGLFGIDLRSPASSNGPPADIGWAPVLMAGVVVSAAGWGLLALLERFISHARAVWAAVAGLVLIVSFSGPLSGSGITAGNRISLILMHLAVAAVLLPFLYGTSSSPLSPTAGLISTGADQNERKGGDEAELSPLGGASSNSDRAIRPEGV